MLSVVYDKLGVKPVTRLYCLPPPHIFRPPTSTTAVYSSEEYHTCTYVWASTPSVGGLVVRYSVSKQTFLVLVHALGVLTVVTNTCILVFIVIIYNIILYSWTRVVYFSCLYYCIFLSYKSIISKTSFPYFTVVSSF